MMDQPIQEITEHSGQALTALGLIVRTLRQPTSLVEKFTGVADAHDGVNVLHNPDLPSCFEKATTHGEEIMHHVHHCEIIMHHFPKEWAHWTSTLLCSAMLGINTILLAHSIYDLYHGYCGLQKLKEMTLAVGGIGKFVDSLEAKVKEVTERAHLRVQKMQEIICEGKP